MTPIGTVHVKIVVDDDLVALRKVSNDLARLAARSPRSFMAAVRLGARLQRTLSLFGRAT